MHAAANTAHLFAQHHHFCADKLLLEIFMQILHWTFGTTFFSSLCSYFYLFGMLTLIITNKNKPFGVLGVRHSKSRSI